MRYKPSSKEYELAKEVATDLGSSVEEILTIVDFQSRYAAHVMEHSGFQAVMLPYLGKFVCNPARVKKLNEAIQQRTNGTL